MSAYEDELSQELLSGLPPHVQEWLSPPVQVLCFGKQLRASAAMLMCQGALLPEVFFDLPLHFLQLYCLVQESVHLTDTREVLLRC